MLKNGDESKNENIDESKNGNGDLLKEYFHRILSCHEIIPSSFTYELNLLQILDKKMIVSCEQNCSMITQYVTQVVLIIAKNSSYLEALLIAAISSASYYFIDMITKLCDKEIGFWDNLSYNYSQNVYINIWKTFFPEEHMTKFVKSGFISPLKLYCSLNENYPQVLPIGSITIPQCDYFFANEDLLEKGEINNIEYALISCLIDSNIFNHIWNYRIGRFDYNGLIRFATIVQKLDLLRQLKQDIISESIEDMALDAMTMEFDYQGGPISYFILQNDMDALRKLYIDSPQAFHHKHLILAMKKYKISVVDWLLSIKQWNWNSIIAKILYTGKVALLQWLFRICLSNIIHSEYDREAMDKINCDSDEDEDRYLTQIEPTDDRKTRFFRHSRSGIKIIYLPKRIMLLESTKEILIDYKSNYNYNYIYILCDVIVNNFPDLFKYLIDRLDNPKILDWDKLVTFAIKECKCNFLLLTIKDYDIKTNGIESQCWKQTPICDLSWL